MITPRKTRHDQEIERLETIIDEKNDRLARAARKMMDLQKEHEEQAEKLRWTEEVVQAQRKVLEDFEYDAEAAGANAGEMMITLRAVEKERDHLRGLVSQMKMLLEG